MSYPRIRMGQRADGYGLWITRPGYNANDLAVPINGYLLRADGFPLMRIFSQTYIDTLVLYEISGGVAYYKAEVFHNFGYRPHVLVSRQYSPSSFGGTDAIDPKFQNIGIDLSKFYLHANVATGGGTPAQTYAIAGTYVTIFVNSSTL